MSRPCVVIEMEKKEPHNHYRSTVAVPLDGLWKLKLMKAESGSMELLLSAEGMWTFVLYSGRDAKLAEFIRFELRKTFLEVMKGLVQSPQVIHMGDMKRVLSS